MSSNKKVLIRSFPRKNKKSVQKKTSFWTNRKKTWWGFFVIVRLWLLVADGFDRKKSWVVFVWGGSFRCCRESHLGPRGGPDSAALQGHGFLSRLHSSHLIKTQLRSWKPLTPFVGDCFWDWNQLTSNQNNCQKINFCKLLISAKIKALKVEDDYEETINESHPTTPTSAEQLTIEATARSSSAHNVFEKAHARKVFDERARSSSKCKKNSLDFALLPAS